MESYLSIDFRYSFNEMKVNNMPPPINATIVPPATNRNKIAPKFESMLPIELSFRPLVKGRAIRTGMCEPAGSETLLCANGLPTVLLPGLESRSLEVGKSA